MGYRNAAIACFVVLWASIAQATFHEWRFSEVYSDPTGTAQFIEFLLPSFPDNESFVGGLIISDSALGNSFTIPSNLPTQPPGNGHFLVGTPGYAALPGVAAPDYTFATNNFFSTAGDTLTYSFVDSLTFTSAQLPTDGVNSLNRTTYGGATLVSQAASPTNLAGTTGTVPEPTWMLVLAVVLPGVLRRRRVA